MSMIDKLSAMIEEEISDAKKYIVCAQEVHDEYPEIADMFTQLSYEEMEHANHLHKAAANLIGRHDEAHHEAHMEAEDAADEAEADEPPEAEVEA